MKHEHGRGQCAQWGGVGFAVRARELRELLLKHDMKREDVFLGEGAEDTSEDTPEEIKKNIVEHIHRIKGEVSSEQRHSYRRLRTFSGVVPVPNGELPFTIWY